jgi:hypothetical protein
MPQKIKLDDGDGFLDVEWKGQTIQFDLFEAHGVYNRLYNENPDTVDLVREWKCWLAEKGIPGISDGGSLDLAHQMREMVDEFAKKKRGSDSGFADSNASTASPSSEPAPATTSPDTPA